MGPIGKLESAKLLIIFKYKIMAEDVSFSTSDFFYGTPKGISSFNDLANRRLQPLGHPSAGDCAQQSHNIPCPHEKFTAYAGTFLALKTDAVKSEIS